MKWLARWAVALSIAALGMGIGCQGSDGGDGGWSVDVGRDGGPDSASTECSSDTDCPGDEACSSAGECLVNCTESESACKDFQTCEEVPSGKKGCHDRSGGGGDTGTRDTGA